MKRLLGIILVLAFCAGLTPAWAAQQSTPPPVTAQAYLVMDADTGQVLVEKGGYEQRYPASITKIMTLALAMEHCGGDLSQQTTVSYRAAHELEMGSSHVALQPGEVVTLQDLFHATILASANDAANVLAEYTAGSIEAFVERMNAKAQELGMTQTHYCNPHGLHDEQHYTSAYDMAVLTRWALGIPGFRELFGATKYTMQPTNKQEKQRLWGTDNCMLVPSKYVYEGTTGGKSGWTHEAGYTMVETVTRAGTTLISVVLDSAKKYDKFADSVALMDYCFDNFTRQELPRSQIYPPQIPVYYSDSDPSVGAAPPQLQESYPLLLHWSVSPDHVAVIFEAPESYMVDAPFEAKMHFVLKEGGTQSSMAQDLMTYTVGIDQDAVMALLDANAQVYVDRPSWMKILKWVLQALFVLVLLLAALVEGRIAYVAYIKAQRKKRRMERRRAAVQSAQQGIGPRVQPLRPVKKPELTRESAPRTPQHHRAQHARRSSHSTKASHTARGRD